MAPGRSTGNRQATNDDGAQRERSCRFVALRQTSATPVGNQMR